MKPLISVVIPTYNREKFIKNTIESVLNQTYQDFEIVVVDDGSTDNTKDVVASIKDKRIRYIYQENKGAQAARNKGLNNAKGNFISFLDCADTWYPTFIEKCLKMFTTTCCDCVYCYVGVDGTNNSIVPREIPTLSGYIYKEALEQGFITSPLSLMVKRKCFDNVGKWDENLKSCQDDDICFRLAKHYKFALIPEILSWAAPKDDVSISKDASRVADGWMILWKKYKNEVIQNCGIDVLIKQYIKCLKRYENIKNIKKQKMVLYEILKVRFSFKYFMKLLMLLTKTL